VWIIIIITSGLIYLAAFSYTFDIQYRISIFSLFYGRERLKSLLGIAMLVLKVTSQSHCRSRTKNKPLVSHRPPDKYNRVR